MKSRRRLYLALSLAVSGLLLGLLFSRIGLSDLVQTLRNINRPALAAYAACALVGTWLRAWRYKRLLEPQPVGWGSILLVTFVRNSLVDLLPARLGSLSYIYILNKRLGFPLETAASTFILCFVLDFLTLGPFLGLAVLAARLGPGIVSGSRLLAVSAAFFVLILLFFWKIIPLASWALKKIKRILQALGWQDKRAARVFEAKSAGIVESIRLIRAGRAGPLVFILSFLIRLAKYLAIFLLLIALLKSHGFSPGVPDFWKTILGTSGAELTSALPVKGLAGFGTWETAWALTFRLLNFDTRLAVVSGLGIHLITNLFEYSLGVLSLLILSVPYFKAKRRQNDPL